MLDEISLVNFIAHLVHASVRIYDKEGKRTYIVDNQRSMQDPLECDKDFEKNLLNMGDVSTPRIYIEKDIVLYSIVKGEDKTFILGPCCCERDTRSAGKYIVAAHYLDASRLYLLSTATSENIYESTLLLYKYVSDNPITKEQMLINNYNIKSFKESVERNMMQVYDQYRENSIVHNPYSQEKREQDSIHRGDVEALKSAINEVYIGELGKMAKDEVRSVKNLALSVLALASRSAIAGGILPEVAFSMSDAYSIRIEEMTNVVEIEALLRTAEFQYAEIVHTLKEKKQQNPIVTGAKDYIIKHLNQKISLSELASTLNVNASYLSDLFSKQEGETLSEYILHEKVNAAKRQLVFTEDSYGKIAYNYGFSSQSHFGKTFKRFTNLTPKEYRKLNKITEIE